jgi:elongation factor Tu
MEKLVAALDT